MTDAEAIEYVRRSMPDLVLRQPKECARDIHRRTLVSEIERHLASDKADWVKRAIEQHGDTDVDWDWALSECVRRICKSGDVLPGELRAFVAARIMPDAGRPTTHPGRRSAAIETRDLYVELAVRELVELGYRAQRNAADHGSEDNLSACAIVARVTGLTEAAVEKIWTSRQRLPSAHTRRKISGKK